MTLPGTPGWLAAGWLAEVCCNAIDYKQKNGNVDKGWLVLSGDKVARYMDKQTSRQKDRQLDRQADR